MQVGAVRSIITLFFLSIAGLAFANTGEPADCLEHNSHDLHQSLVANVGPFSNDPGGGSCGNSWTNYRTIYRTVPTGWGWAEYACAAVGGAAGSTISKRVRWAPAAVISGAAGAICHLVFSEQEFEVVPVEQYQDCYTSWDEQRINCHEFCYNWEDL